MNPLAGRRVVITRAADQAGSTADLVSSFDALPVVVPLIEVVDEPKRLLSCFIKGYMSLPVRIPR